MAERLRYKSQAQPLRLPQLQFTGAAADAQGKQQVANSLGQMTSFFLQQTQIQAKLQGEEYGALNTPTRKQIEDAKNSGTPLDLPGGNMTEFDRAAKQASYTMAADTLQELAREEITKKVTAAYQSRSNPQALADDIDAIIAGYAATFEQDAPVLTRSWKAKMGIYANSQYESYAKWKIGQDRQQTLADAYASNAATDAGPTVDDLAKITPGGK